MSETTSGSHSPCRIPEGFRPNVKPEQIAQQFPAIGDPRMVLEEFINYHLSKGTTSRNWTAHFLGFCAHRQRQGRQQTQAERSTDSMGFPLGVGGSRLDGSEGDYGRRFLAAYNDHIDAGLGPNEARIAAERDLEGESHG